ncbi:MAG: right-handed parallel beta-helix repeat-containing protein [Arachnia sp.]
MRIGSLQALLRLICGALLATLLVATSASPAHAATALDDAANALGVGRTYSVQRISGAGDITSELAAATKKPAGASKPRLVVLKAGTFEVRSKIRVADNVYLVAEPRTRVTWRGSDGEMVRFDGVTSGVYGGTWDGAHKGTSHVFNTTASTVRYVDLLVKNAGANGIVAYKGSKVTLRDVSATGNARDGVYVQQTTLTVSRLKATMNERNGLMLASGSTGTVVGSTLDKNGQAVKGSTTDKTGHGLAVDGSSATVSSSTMSGNKVCGVSLTKGAKVAVSSSTIASNGRHGVGTRSAVTGSFTNTKISKNGYNGVLATDSRTSITLTSSTVDASKKFGLSVPSKGSATLRKTTVKGSGSANISVTGGGSLTLKESNTVSSAKGDGIAVSSKGRLTVTAAGNVISSNKANGLRVSGSGSTGRIEKSVTVKGNKDVGILVHVKGKLVTVKNAVSGAKNKTVVTRSGGKVVAL